MEVGEFGGRYTVYTHTHISVDGYVLQRCADASATRNTLDIVYAFPTCRCLYGKQSKRRSPSSKQRQTQIELAARYIDSRERERPLRFVFGRR